MAKYSKINFTEEGVQILLKMASDLRDRYEEYAQAGNNLVSRYEALHVDLGVDAEQVLEILNRLNDELTLNCTEIMELGSYCETLAKQMEVKLGTKIVTRTHFI